MGTNGQYRIYNFSVASLAAMIYEDRPILKTEEACHTPSVSVYQWAIHPSGAPVLVKRNDDPNLLRIATRLENRATISEDKVARAAFLRNNPPPA